jgi:exonuclease SbcC
MRPCSLTLTAFGPFQGRETISFEALGENPLFLINGPTGSGKTTLLDAICFALYGRTTGDEREGGQMRCDHAPDDLLTEVDFIFELAGSRYRIRRVPEQQRPKARGEGSTTHATEAQFWRLDSVAGDQLIVANKVTEATREIEQLTGLSVEQFRQVMVLPQGKFRDLLLAESKAREAIFSQLFQTRIYRQLEEQLKVRSAGIRREVENSRKVQQGILEGIGLQQKQDLQRGLNELQPAVEQALQQKGVTEKKYTLALQQLEQARSISADFQALEHLRYQQGELEKQRAEIATKRQRLEWSEQADQIRPIMDTRDRYRLDFSVIERKLLEANQRLTATKQRLDKSRVDLANADQLIQSLDNAKQQLSTLNSYQERASRLEQVHIKLDSVVRAEQAVSARQRQIADDYQQKTDQRVKNQLERSQLLQAISNQIEAPLALQQITSQLSERQAIEALIVERDKKQQQLNKAEQAGKKLASDLNVLVEQDKIIQLSWHKGQAARLARDLKNDEPCPVCGSVSHPAPATTLESLPSELELEQSAKRVQQAQALLSAARENYAHIKSSLESLVEQINKKQETLGDVLQQTVAQLQEHQEILKQQAELLTKNQSNLQTLETADQQLQRKVTELQSRLDEVNTQLAEARVELAAIRSELQSAEQELPESYRQAGVLADAIKQMRIEVDRLSSVIKAAREEHQQAHGDWEAAKATTSAAEEQKIALLNAKQSSESQWKNALNESAFEDEAHFLQALMDDVTKAACKEQLQAYETAVQQNAGALKQQQSRLEGQKLPDLAVMQQALEQLAKSKAEAEAHWQALDKRLGQLQRAEQELQRIEKQCEMLEKRYAQVGTLSDVANGQTGDKISLQRFVLSVLLDDVLVESSHRLHLMTKGRYQLLRKESRAKGNRASGLEMEVEDAYSGKCRPVATLSGGESFLAALSLALGLSDVVQAYSGGMRLDTLFIDEGFGSLDPDSLDLAIRTLIDLQASGRMVGVISHVAELKEQMPLRLDIIPSRAGSHVTLVTP